MNFHKRTCRHCRVNNVLMRRCDCLRRNRAFRAAKRWRREHRAKGVRVKVAGGTWERRKSA